MIQDAGKARSAIGVVVDRAPVLMAVKRTIDILAGLALALILWPLILAVAAGVRLRLGAPILFVQERLGIGGSTIRLPKFRSMTDARDAHGELLGDDSRTPPFGDFIRRYRFDELPSFVSLLRGDIALVGPRPLTAAVDASRLGGLARLTMRPGFTGLAQVSGNTLLTAREKVALDLYYIEHWSLLLDIKIVIRTVGTIVRGERRQEQIIKLALDRQAPHSTGSA